MQVQVALKVLIKMNRNRPTPRNIIIKMANFKDRENLKKIRLSAVFSTETLQARREWQEIFQVMKNKGLQLKLLYPAKLSFKMEGEKRRFPEKS